MVEHTHKKKQKWNNSCIFKDSLGYTDFSLPVEAHHKTVSQSQRIKSKQTEQKPNKQIKKMQKSQ